MLRLSNWPSVRCVRLSCPSVLITESHRLTHVKGCIFWKVKKWLNKVIVYHFYLWLGKITWKLTTTIVFFFLCAFYSLNRAPNIPVDPFSLRVRKHRSMSQLSLVDEEMDEFNKQKRGSFFVHFELSKKSKYCLIVLNWNNKSYLLFVFSNHPPFELNNGLSVLNLFLHMLKLIIFLVSQYEHLNFEWKNSTYRR